MRDDRSDYGPDRRLDRRFDRGGDYGRGSNGPAGGPGGHPYAGGPFRRDGPPPFRRDGPQSGPRGGEGEYRAPAGGPSSHPDASAAAPPPDAFEIDREKTCPLLIRVFCKPGGHHKLEEFAIRGKEPGSDSEIQVREQVGGEGELRGFPMRPCAWIPPCRIGVVW